MKNKKLFVFAILGFIAVLLVATFFGILQYKNKINTGISVFGLMFVLISLGFGIIIFLYGLITKGGYETAIGLGLLCVSEISLMIFYKVDVVITVILSFVTVIIAIFIMFLLKSSSLFIERKNEDGKKVDYTETLKQENKKYNNKD